MCFRLSLLALVVLAAGCSSTGETPDSMLPERPGLAVVEATGSVAEATARLDAALDDADAVSVIAQVDHSRNAASVSLSLRPTVVRMFGNPALGTPLMLRNQLAGLDLPQKMLIYRDEDNRTIVAYNTTTYLAARYGLAGESVLGQLAAALDGFAVAAARSGQATVATAPQGVTVGAGIVTVASDASAGVTYDRLRRNIVLNPNLSIVAEVDHQENASRAGFTLRPTRLIVFGNPRAGTPLMVASQTAGIDLPQSMLVYQPASGPAQVAYEDPAFIAERHGIPATLEQIALIRTALAGLADEATREL